MAFTIASQMRKIIHPQTAQFTTFQAIEYLNSRKILTFDIQDALRILISQGIIKQVDFDVYESIVEGKGKEVSFKKIVDARNEMQGLLLYI